MGGATGQRPLDAAAFRRALGRFGSGITVITTRTVAGEDIAMTASAFSSTGIRTLTHCSGSRSPVWLD